MGGKFDLIILLLLWVGLPNVLFILSNFILRLLVWLGGKNIGASINGLWNLTYCLLWPVLVLPYTAIQWIHGDEHSISVHMDKELSLDSISERPESKPLKAAKYCIDFLPLVIFFIIHILLFGLIQTGNEFENMASNAAQALELSNFKEAVTCCFKMFEMVIKDTITASSAPLLNILKALWIYVLIFCSSHFTTYAHIRKLYRPVNPKMCWKGLKKVVSHFFGAWFVWQVFESLMTGLSFVNLGNASLWYEIVKDKMIEWGICLFVFMAISFAIFALWMIAVTIYGPIVKPYERD